jgi:tetratricopeptide (TPR) repeat protein
MSFFLAVPVSAQTAQSGAQSTPQALKATYEQAIKAQDWPAALATAQQLVDSYPTSANLLMLANAQLYVASAQHATNKMEATLATYDSALAMAEQEKPAKGQPDQAWKDGESNIYLGKGNALLKLKREADAIGAYNRAAELSSNPGKAYFNVCATAYNAGDTNGAVTARRKSVQVDPTHADTWFVLGSSLFMGASSDASGKFVISAETRQALQKYLELAPDGPHAADVKQMLDYAAK